VSSFGLAGLVLIVDETLASVRFYEDVVGLTLENGPSDESAWFWAAMEGVPQRVALHRGCVSLSGGMDDFLGVF